MKKYEVRDELMSKMDDVAKLANVSTATVSRVLSNNINVSKATRERVLNAINELGYKPNRLASNLRKNKSCSIAVIIPDISNPLYSEVVKGAKDTALDLGYHILLFESGNSAEQEKEYVELVKEKFADGIILATTKMLKEEIYQLSSEIPVVLACEYVEGYEVPSVSIDNTSAARAATEYLISLGHDKIGLITGPLDTILCRDRVKGYRQAMLLHEKTALDFLIQEGDFSAKSGYDTTMKFLASNDRPTAILASNDEMAVGAITACKDKGIRIPDEISVMGFDDIPLSTWIEPRLSTVSQPKYEIGKQAMNMLFNIINKKEGQEKQIVLPYHIIPRDSTKALLS